MSAVKKCPTCGAELAAGSVDGLCLKCLGRLAFLTDGNGAAGDVPLRLGDYEVLEEIARGGMGVVYRARQLSLNRIVALKVVLHGPFSSRDFVRRFRQEAQAVAALRHPNIVAIHEVGEDHGTHFLSLEFIDGQNLAELVRDRPLPVRRAAAYLQVIAGAVEHAHQRGVLHRDLKPSNILVDSFDQPRVTDFGLAKLAGDNGELTVPGQVLGSPNYMPPEQAAGKFADSKPTADVYSLGAILYELVTGRPPFQGENLQAVLAQLRDLEPVPPRRLNPGVPVDLQTICLKCLQKDPARRYASARELAEDLGRFLAGEPVAARPVAWLEQGWLWCRRRPWLAGTAAALALSVTLGAAGILWQWRQAEYYARGELQQRLIAEHDAAVTRLNLYAADIAVASQEVQNGLPGLARETLKALRPGPGETDLRGFEWYYLWNLSRGDQLCQLKGHQRTVTCVAFSPVDRRLASGSQDGTVRIWDTARDAACKELTVSTGAVWSAAYTPDGHWLMTGGTDQVQFWDTRSWQSKQCFPGGLAALGGDLLATAQSSPFFWEAAGEIALWNWQTGRRLGTLPEPGRAVALSADGSLLAVAGTNTGFSLWHTATGELMRKYPTQHPVWSLQFSPDGRRLLTTEWTSEATLWTLDPPAPPQMLAGHQLHVWSAVFSGDGAVIATTSSDQSVRVWDAASLRLKSVLHGHGSEVWCAAFSPDGRLIASGGKDRNVLLWPAAGGNPPGELPHEMAFRPLFSPDGRRLVTVNPDTGDSMLWNTDDQSLVRKRLAEGRQIVGFSQDGRKVITFESDRLKLEFWRPEGNTPETEVALKGVALNPAPFAYLGMSPAQDCFFAIDAAGTVHVWKTGTGDLVRTFAGPPPPIRNAVLSPHGKQLAVCVERENVARLYDCATGAEHPLAGHHDFVSGLAFSPAGTTLATGSVDGTIRLWRTADGSLLAALPGHLQEATDVAFSPDGQTLASLGRNESFKLWHLPTLREVVSESEPHAGMWLVFSPDGRKLALETDTDKLRLLPAPAE